MVFRLQLSGIKSTFSSLSTKSTNEHLVQIVTTNAIKVIKSQPLQLLKKTKTEAKIKGGSELLFEASLMFVNAHFHTSNTPCAIRYNSISSNHMPLFTKCF